MFTVMHRQNGIDAFYKAPSVQYHGPHADGPNGLHLMCADEALGGVTSRVLWGGEAFVMNDAGATIGRYRLDFPITNGTTSPTLTA